MVKFRISLQLHNFTKSNKKTKDSKINKFYKCLALLIKINHNCDIKQLQKQFQGYCERLIKIRKNMLIETLPGRDNPLCDIFDTIYPPTISIDIEFKMTSKREEVALKQFYKEYKHSMNKKSYKELRMLYYSTKIINFVNNLRSLMNENVFWDNYTYFENLKTKYTPKITVSDATVLSLA